VDRNLLIAVALSFLVVMLWGSLQEAPPPPPGQESSEPAPGPGPGPEEAAPELAPLPEAAPETLAAPAAQAESLPEARSFAFETADYRAEVVDVGAGLRGWRLAGYHTGGRDPRPIELATAEPPFDLLGATSLRDLGLGDLARVAWPVESRDASGVTFALTRDGVSVRKAWRFEDLYTVRLQLHVENRSNAPVTSDFAVDWPAHVVDANDFREQALAALHGGALEQALLGSFGRSGFWNAFTGPPDKVVDYRSEQGENQWAGVNTTYFLSVLLPDEPSKASVRFEVLEPGRSGLARIFFEPVRIPPGLALARNFSGYLGPKLPATLDRVGGDTIRAIDLGWSWVRPLTRFFGWLLHEIYAFVPNYGVAIILLTILVRVVTTPLTMRQMRSMERMRAVQPQLKEIQEKFKDDRQKQSEEMMRLYRKEKVNPLGGCLPMLLQLPVFIGLFYALRGSIELRQAPFFGWIVDLSAPEALFEIPGIGIPVRVLPLIMGATMVLQQRITPMQVDPAQARMMMTIMPIMMTVIFYQFASGLVLYWMVSNVLAIAHQLWVGRRMRAGKT